MKRPLGGDGTATIGRGCVVACRLPESEANRAIVRACEARGIRTRVEHPARIDAHAADDAELILCRLPSGVPAAWTSALLSAERTGRVFLNRPSVLTVAHDKARALTELAAAGLAVPPTVCVMRDGPASLDALPGKRFVVKPVQGAAGRGVTMGLARERAALCAAAFAEASGPVLVQPLLGDGIDRRLLVVGDSVAAAFARRPPDSGARASLAYGGLAEPWSPSDEERTLGLAAARTLGLDVAGVDMLRDEDGPLLLEVNACPGLAGIERATGRGVASAIADLVLATLEQTGRADDADRGADTR